MSESTKAPRRTRRPVARHGRLSSPHPFRQILSVLGVILAVVLVSGVSVGAFAVWDSAQAIAQNAVVLDEDETVPPSIGEIEGGVNLLLVGTDSCEGQDTRLFPRCGIDDDGLERNDVTMLVNISDNPRRVTVVSFPRDMLVPIPECSDGEGGTYSAMSQMPINASYGNGGLGCTVRTVENLTGFDIQFAGAIRWTGVINMSDAIGGVDVCVAGDISDSHTGLQLSEGWHTLQGTEALQFLRIRHGIGDGSDLGRISNQQQFMSSMVRKLQADSTLANPAILFNLATTAMQQVNQQQLILDSNLSNPTLMVQIAMAVKDVPYEDIVFVQYPTEYAAGVTADNNRVLPLTTVAGELFDAIRANKGIILTGDPSQGYGVEVEGDATAPTPTPEPSDSASPDASPSATAEPTPEPTSEAVELSDQIAGTSAAQVTCTVPEGFGF